MTTGPHYSDLWQGIAREVPDRPAIITRDESVTWGRFAAETGALARHLTEVSGLGFGGPNFHAVPTGHPGPPPRHWPPPPEPTEQREAGEPQPEEGAGAAGPEAPTEPEPQDPEAAHEAPQDEGPAPERGDGA